MSTRTFVLLWLAMSLVPPILAQSPPPPGANPLVEAWTTPFEVPPFREIKVEHFVPAIKESIAQQRRTVDAVAASTAPPTFENTIVALEDSQEVLSKVTSVFFGLQSAETNEQLQKINREVSPLLSALRDDIRMNAALFARIKTIWEARERSNLTPDQQKLVDDTYRSFVRGGANLDAAQKEELKKLNAELSMLGIKFADNLLHDTNSYRLVIEKEADLAGLPPSVVSMGAEAAVAAKMAGKWVYTLQAPSIWPFLQYADNRELRRQILDAYTSHNNHDDAYDNKAIASKIAAIRAQRARLSKGEGPEKGLKGLSSVRDGA